MRPTPSLDLSLSLFALVCALAGAASAGATTVVVPSLEEMTFDADVIAHVVVTERHVTRERDRVVTTTTLDVKDGIKGAKRGSQLKVLQLGGVLDGEGSWIVGAHRFAIGDELVFFGVRQRDVLVPYGVGFGLFRVVEDVTGASVLELVGDVVAVEVHDGGTRTQAPVARRFDSLPSFKRSLRHILAGEFLPRQPVAKKLAPMGVSRN